MSLVADLKVFFRGELGTLLWHVTLSAVGGLVIGGSVLLDTALLSYYTRLRGKNYMAQGEQVIWILAGPVFTCIAFGWFFGWKPLAGSLFSLSLLCSAIPFLART